MSRARASARVDYRYCSLARIPDRPGLTHSATGPGADNGVPLDGRPAR
jgi:hypothetical protein